MLPGTGTTSRSRVESSIQTGGPLDSRPIDEILGAPPTRSITSTSNVGGRPGGATATATWSPRGDRTTCDSSRRPTSAGSSTTRQESSDASAGSTSAAASTRLPSGEPIESAPPVRTTRPSRSPAWTAADPSGVEAAVEAAMLAATGDAESDPDGDGLPQATARKREATAGIARSGPTDDRSGHSDNALGERRLIRRCHHR